ncbi:hypothetical protein ANCCAN_11188 [Ancylostoma caninum]|uniref:Uncharacterized protein n=1 Tax=Ancylostoma caninum TaxID=29170 RepID=A0A368GEQ9_ANCCA|nr:hypothetical protein ANCCAN_11188 [Ancylostoma caninum]
MGIPLPILLLTIYASTTVGSDLKDLGSKRTLLHILQGLPVGLPEDYEYAQGWPMWPEGVDEYDYHDDLSPLPSDVVVVKKKMIMYDSELPRQADSHKK